MKTILLVLALAFASFSCRTITPIDPNTGKPGARMLPDPLPCGCQPPFCLKNCKSKGVVGESK